MQTAVSASLIKKQLGLGKPIQLEVISNSMAPLIQTGDIVEITAVSPAHLKIGNIVTVQTQNHLLTHRLIDMDVQAKTVWLRGEWQQKSEPFEFDQIIGKVTAVKKRKRWLNLSSHLWQFVFSWHFYMASWYLGIVKWIKQRL